jgi:RNA polymerase sigma-70 factor (ECF subfamily)
MRPEQAGVLWLDAPREEQPIVERAQRGDREAFTLLVRRYERTALAVAYAVLSDGDAAGDAVQDAFLRAWQRLGDLRQVERFGGWLCGIVRNTAYDVHRAARRQSRARAELPATVPSGQGDPVLHYQRKESSERVAAALATLDEVTRTAVVLRYYQNMPSKQIAEVVGLAPAAVDMRLMRARQTLRERLSEPPSGEA